MAIVSNPHIEEKHKCYMIDKLVKLGTEINHSNIFGETALYLAVLSHQKFVVECLLEMELIQILMVFMPLVL